MELDLTTIGTGLTAIGAGLSIGLAAVGTGLAQGRIGAAGAGVIAEKPRPIKRTMMSDYWRLYVPKMLDAKNKKALSEMTDQQMEEWLNYFSAHNQFLQLGQWLTVKK